ncbi:hypothetical protein Nepgr_004760 [Nepenthes gracilis]|uniref:Glycoside hydrolase family 19 catalytic domain-containing protein n=1 Tax=Nepenthes gracilis TaxID=150966 RepID=A0AAD3S1X8_NEPGR|nr:hypothetical protein Nepgr_004760 [Nepenthes gracilis]
MLNHWNDDDCPAKGFDTYDAFVDAAKSFPIFAATGDNTTGKREIAAFMAQTSHETTDYFINNYNYGAIGEAIGVDLLNNLDLVENDLLVSFQTTIWFWMTVQSPKPSCHEVNTGEWMPSAADKSAGRAPGFGMVTNIINGGVECGHGQDARVADRVGFHKQDCGLWQQFGLLQSEAFRRSLWWATE